MLERGVELFLLLIIALTKEILDRSEMSESIRLCHSLLRLGILMIIQFEGFNTMVLGCLD